jgi:hypothetical protein
MKRVGFLAAAGVVIGLLVVGLAIARSHRSQTGGALAPDLSAMPLGPRGEASSLASAEQTMPFRIYRPHQGLADDGEITKVWVREGTVPEVALEYNSGIVVFVGPSQIIDPQDFYNKQIADGVHGSVELVHGAPVLLIHSEDNSHLALDTVVSGIEVQVIKIPGGTDQDLTLMAESIA